MSGDFDDEDSQAASLVIEYLNGHPKSAGDELEDKAQELAVSGEQGCLANRAPSSIAAGSIYLAALLVNHKMTQDEVADICDVSTPTIRDCYQELFKHEVSPTSQNQPNNQKDGKELTPENKHTNEEPSHLSRNQIVLILGAVSTAWALIWITAIGKLGPLLWPAIEINSVTTEFFISVISAVQNLLAFKFSTAWAILADIPWSNPIVKNLSIALLPIHLTLIGYSISFSVSLAGTAR